MTGGDTPDQLVCVLLLNATETRETKMAHILSSVLVLRLLSRQKSSLQQQHRKMTLAVQLERRSVGWDLGHQGW